MIRYSDKLKSTRILYVSKMSTDICMYVFISYTHTVVLLLPHKILATTLLLWELRSPCQAPLPRAQAAEAEPLQAPQ